MTAWAVAHIRRGMATKSTTLAPRSSDEANLVKRADALARRLKTTRVAISGKLFNDGKKLDRLAAGGGVYHDVYLAADRLLSEMEKGLV